MRSNVGKMVFLGVFVSTIAGCNLQGDYNYGQYICDPESAYTNGMMSARSGQSINPDYGSGCPVRTHVMMTSYRRGYERGLLLSPLPGGEHPLPPKPIESLPAPYSAPQAAISATPPSIVHGNVAPMVSLTRARPTSAAQPRVIILNPQPWSPAAASRAGHPSVAQTQSAPPTPSRSSMHQQPWPPTVSTQRQWKTLAGQPWPPTAMAPATALTTQKSVALTPSLATHVSSGAHYPHSAPLLPTPAGESAAKPVVLSAETTAATNKPIALNSDKVMALPHDSHHAAQRKQTSFAPSHQSAPTAPTHSYERPMQRPPGYKNGYVILN